MCLVGQEKRLLGWEHIPSGIHLFRWFLFFVLFLLLFFFLSFHSSILLTFIYVRIFWFILWQRILIISLSTPPSIPLLPPPFVTPHNSMNPISVSCTYMVEVPPTGGWANYQQLELWKHYFPSSNHHSSSSSIRHGVRPSPINIGISSGLILYL